MKIFSAQQIKKWDSFTIKNEPVTPQNLMERAAKSSVQALLYILNKVENFYLFCGAGNNGGDGFAMARLLYQKGLNVTIFYQIENSGYSEEAAINLKRVQEISGISVVDLSETDNFQFKSNSIIIDCLFGTGLNRKLEGQSSEVIQHLNKIKLPKIAIDIPSGLFADKIHEDKSVIFRADHTLSFQSWKKSFLHPETGKFCGKIHILDISLKSDFIKYEKSNDFTIDDELIKEIYQPRNDFSHKGTFGKTVIVAGSYGKIGAAVLATKSALKSGSGITSTLSPKCGYEILQSTCPEAMFLQSGDNFIDDIYIEDDAVIGIGPGLGTNPITEKAFLKFLKMQKKPLIIDADALNILSKNAKYLKFIPKNSILTPHPKEFERLFGKTDHSFERLKLAQEKAKELNIIIVLKDHHTQICSPNGKVYYNITGNSGMAKGGSGDVLLGIITSLLSQNYTPENAAIFGIWLHGKAGDFAAKKFSKESMLPTDLINELGNVFKNLN